MLLLFHYMFSNLVPLRDFFLSGMYKDDINTDNPLGAGGKVAIAYAQLLKEIWYYLLRENGSRQLWLFFDPFTSNRMSD